MSLDDILDGSYQHGARRHLLQMIPVRPQLATCYMNTKPKWVDCSCDVPEGTPRLDPSDVGGFSPSPRAKAVGIRGQDIEFFLVAEDEDSCSELEIQSTSRGAITDQLYLLDHVRLAPNRVSRKFVWPTPAPVRIGETEVVTDNRASDTVICFYAFDGYLTSDMRCVRIVIPDCAQFTDSSVRISSSDSLVLAYFRMKDCTGNTIVAGNPYSKCSGLPCSIFELKEDKRSHRCEGVELELRSQNPKLSIRARSVRFRSPVAHGSASRGEELRGPGVRSERLRG